MGKTARFLAAPLFFICLFASPVLAQDKWEYKVINLTEGLGAQITAMSIEQLNTLLGKEVSSENVSQTDVFLKLIEKRLNDLGNEGWELVVLEEQLATFKRKKIEIPIIILLEEKIR